MASKNEKRIKGSDTRWLSNFTNLVYQSILFVICMTSRPCLHVQLPHQFIIKFKYSSPQSASRRHCTYQLDSNIKKPYLEVKRA